MCVCVCVCVCVWEALTSACYACCHHISIVVTVQFLFVAESHRVLRASNGNNPVNQIHMPFKHICHTLFKLRALFENCTLFFLIIFRYKYCGHLRSMHVEFYSIHYVNFINTKIKFIVYLVRLF